LRWIASPLCSSGASFITGADVLVVAGGYVGMGHDRPDAQIPYDQSYVASS
jgi:hypothetical protein